MPEPCVSTQDHAFYPTNLQLTCRSAMLQALLVELLELKAHHAKALDSRTVLGHMRNGLGYAMSGYCLYRVMTSAKALLFGEDFSSDPVSRCAGMSGLHVVLSLLQLFVSRSIWACPS